VPCRKMLHGARLSSVCLAWLIMLSMPGRAQNLRCYVCGGNSGTPCGQGNGEEVDEDGALIHDPVQECNDLINNRGCVKQYVNKVVLLRGCWLDGTNKCLKNGAAEVCTCSTDLCNSVPRPAATSSAHLLLLLLVGLAVHFVPLRLFQLEPRPCQQHVGEQRAGPPTGHREDAREEEEEAERIRTRSPIRAAL